MIKTEYSGIFFFDLETTGTNVKKDRPCQIALLRGMENPETVMNLLVNPKIAIDPGAQAVHGISNQRVAQEEDYQSGLYKMNQHLHSAIVANGDGSYTWPILAGFNSSTFDTPMADHCYGRKVFSTYPQLDVLDILYRYYPHLLKKKLSLVYKEFFNEELTGAHGAMEDCYGTARVLDYACKDQNVTAAELVEELKTPVVYDIMPIGKHSGLEVDQVPAGWARWMYENAKDMRPDLDATINYILFEK